MEASHAQEMQDLLLNTVDAKVYQGKLEQIQSTLKDKIEQLDELDKQFKEQRRAVIEKEEALRGRELEIESLRKQTAEVVLEARLKKDQLQRLQECNNQLIEENETLQRLLKDKKERLNELESQTLTL